MSLRRVTREEFKAWLDDYSGIDYLATTQDEFVDDLERAGLIEFADAVPGSPLSPSRLWCHARHICHHWWEDECSAACDRGEHDHPVGAADCADSKSGGSGS